MKKMKTLIYLFIFSAILILAGCEKAQSPPQSTPAPSRTGAQTPAPTPSPAPTPTPKRFDADIVDIPGESAVEAMDIDDIEDTPFFAAVTSTDDVVMVEFWSPNAVYSAAVSETLETLSQNTGVKVVRVNVEENPTLADNYGLVVLPSVYVFMDGVQVDAVLGEAPYADYALMVEKYR